MVNGTLGHALDFDDILDIMPGHPSVTIVSALLSTLHGHTISARRVLDAHRVGVEIGAKIGIAITMGHYDRGFHATGSVGIFAALAALARLHRLERSRTRIAFGIASSMASGVRRNFGTMTKPLHSGWAAHNALVAYTLARSGFTAAPDALEAKSGFFAAYGVEASNPQVAVAGLGKPWAIMDPGIALKKFPCYGGSQRCMDGALQLRQRMGFSADTLAHLECRMPPGGMKVLIYPNPVTGLEGKFSIQYALAAGVLDGKYSLWSFTDEAVNRPAIRELMKRITALEDEACGRDDPLLQSRASGARGFVEVEARTTDGRCEKVQVRVSPGYPSRELNWDEIEHKFMDCATHGGLKTEQARRAFEALATFERADDLSAIVRLMTISQ
jgi:2-methylcitrate dehydratase PrpD